MVRPRGAAIDREAAAQRDAAAPSGSRSGRRRAHVGHCHEVLPIIRALPWTCACRSAAVVLGNAVLPATCERSCCHQLLHPDIVPGVARRIEGSPTPRVASAVREDQVDGDHGRSVSRERRAGNRRGDSLPWTPRSKSESAPTDGSWNSGTSANARRTAASETMSSTGAASSRGPSAGRAAIDAPRSSAASGHRGRPSVAPGHRRHGSRPRGDRPC